MCQLKIDGSALRASENSFDYHWIPDSRLKRFTIDGCQLEKAEEDWVLKAMDIYCVSVVCFVKPSGSITLYNPSI